LFPKQDVRKNEWLDALQTKNKGSQREEEKGKRKKIEAQDIRTPGIEPSAPAS
jgi:hypothetical protein